MHSTSCPIPFLYSQKRSIRVAARHVIVFILRAGLEWFHIMNLYGHPKQPLRPDFYQPTTTIEYRLPLSAPRRSSFLLPFSTWGIPKEVIKQAEEVFITKGGGMGSANTILGGGFKDFLCSPRKLGKILQINHYICSSTFSLGDLKICINACMYEYDIFSSNPVKTFVLVGFLIWS